MPVSRFAESLSAGEGSQGPRWYDRQLVELPVSADVHWRRAILVRRSISDPTELAAYRCFYPAGTTRDTLVQVAGSRWTIETDIEEAKSEVGLDEYEVRSWAGWYRHISLALVAHAFLAMTKASGAEAALTAEKRGSTHRRRSTMQAFKAGRGLSCP